MTAMTADASRALWQIRYEVRSFFRNRRSAVFGLMFPVILLVMLGALGQNATIDSRDGIPLDTYLVPGLMAYGLMITTFTGVVMTTALLRDHGVLKRVQGTPMPWWAYMTGRIGATVTAAGVMATAMAAIGWVAFDVPVRASTLPGFVVTLVLAVACLTSLALGLARFIPDAESARPIAIGILIPVSIISGQFGPVDDQPTWLHDLAGALPVKPITDALQVAFDPRTHGAGLVGHDLAVLALWTVVGISLMIGFFRTQTKRA